MINLTPFHLYEATSSVSSFLKANYTKIFQDPNKTLSNQFTNFTKRIDKEKNVADLYRRFIRANQTSVQNEINNTETIDEINKILSDNIKFFYFSLKPVVNKLQNDEFTIEEIFSHIGDKRFKNLMDYPEDRFSNGVTQFINDGVVPWIKKDAKLDTTEKEKQQTQEPKSTSERIKYNIEKILEQANPEAELLAYKKSAMKWLNMNLYDPIKLKTQLLLKLGAATSNSVDQLSKQMKGSTNDSAKKMIINHITNMDKIELEKLAEYLGIKKEDLGQL